MNNPIPEAWKPLRSLAEHAADGLHTLQTIIGVKQNTEPLVRADLAAAIAANGTYQASKTARLAAVVVEQAADADAKAMIRTVRDVLKQRLGETYSQAWDEVGFTSNSLAVPRTLAGRAALLGSMMVFFQAHPAYEVPALNVAFGAIEDTHTALVAAITGVADAKAAQETKRNARDLVFAALRHRLRGLVQELSKLLGPLDPRWKQFGFNEPGDTSRPGTPEHLVVNPGAPHHLVPGWDYTPGADRFHVYRQIVGVDPDYVFAKTVSDTMADLNSFPSGAHVRTRVTAVNAAGESLPTEPVEQVVP